MFHAWMLMITLPDVLSGHHLEVFKVLVNARHDPTARGCHFGRPLLLGSLCLHVFLLAYDATKGRPVQVVLLSDCASASLRSFTCVPRS